MYKRNKFSFRYRVEKWFYEDSKKDFRILGDYICEFLVLIAMLAVILIIPAFFH